MLLKIKIRPTKEITTICPPAILANKRIIKANGLLKTPTNSIGIKINQRAAGLGANICFQYVFEALKLVTSKVTTARTKVKAILPVRFALMGINPKTLFIKIRKK